MGVSFEPLKCSCGLTCSYLVRWGDKHESFEIRDEWQGVATAYCHTSDDGQPYVYIMGACGEMNKRDYSAILAWLFNRGFVRVEYEHKDRDKVVTREQWERRKELLHST